MKLELANNWRKVADAARTTIGMGNGTKEPKDSWKKRILLAEHSPIRKLKAEWKWEGLKYWVSVHLVRHWNGISHFVKTQRSDRTGTNRDKAPQDALVNHEAEANAQALINISRKRLCAQASKETREAWNDVKEAVKSSDEVLASVMVPECIYRGFCPEFECCGYSKTEGFEKDLIEYREVK